MILETYREVMRDVLDLPALKELLRDLHSRKITMVEVETPTASPFASSLLFDYVATYMYEGDTPNAERRAAALALDRDLLAELLGQEELRELIDPEALAEVAAQLQHLTEAGLAKDRDGLQQILRRLGDLTAEECEQRTEEGYSAASMLEKLVKERRAALVRIAGEERYIAAEDAGLYRDALGVPQPAGLPESFLEPVEDALVSLVRRYAATHVPFPTRQLADRYGVDPSSALRSWSARATWSAASCCPGGTAREWCEADVLRRLRRASLARLRQEVEATDQRELARFLPSWQNVDAHGRSGAGPGPAARGARLAAGSGAHAEDLGAGRPAAPPRLLQPDLARRALHQRRAGLDRCRGAGPQRRQGRPLLPRGRPPGRARRPPTPSSTPPEGEIHDAIRERLGQGPCFWLDLLELDGSAEELHEALWDLAWSGEVTNDAFAPLRAPRLRAAQRSERGGRRFARRRAAAAGTVIGRWSLSAPLFEGAPSSGPRTRALAELMLERHGIVTRETAIAEGIPGGFASIYGELQNLELLGTARRGYFVEGLGGAQFALPGAVERLRSLPQADGVAPGSRRNRPRQPVRGHPLLAQARGTAAGPPAPPGPT